MLAVNTHGFYKKLVSKGFSLEQAEGLTEAHTEFFEEDLESRVPTYQINLKDELVTKEDFQETKMNSKLWQLRRI